MEEERRGRGKKERGKGEIEKKRRRKEGKGKVMAEERLEEAVTGLIDRDPTLASRLKSQFKKLAKD